DEPISALEQKKQEAKKGKAFGDVVKGALKKAKVMKDTAAGSIAAGAAAGAGLGLAVAGPIGAIAGAAIGAAAGWFSKGPRWFGWRNMVREEGRSVARRKAVGTIAREAIAGAIDGIVAGVALTGLAVVAGVVVGLLTPIGIVAGAAAVLGASGWVIGISAATGVVGRGIQGGMRVFMPKVRTMAEEKTGERREEEQAVEGREIFAGELSKYGQHVREEDTDERGQMLSAMLGRSEDGTPDGAIRWLLDGERKAPEKVETKGELRDRIKIREVRDEKGNLIAYMAEVNPAVGPDGKPVNEGKLTDEERMEAYSMYMDEVRKNAASIIAAGGKPPVPPDFVCAPFMAFASQNVSTSEQAGNEDGTVGTVARDMIAHNESLRRIGKPLCIFSNGLAPTKSDEGRGFSGVVFTSYEQVRALAKGTDESGIAPDLSLAAGENIGFRRHNGKIIVLVRCDDGQVITRDFGRMLTSEDIRTISAMVGLAAIKAKGRKAALDYDAPENIRKREQESREAGRFAALLGRKIGDTDIEIALGDVVSRDLLDNSNLGSEDIRITAEGIFIRIPGVPAGAPGESKMIVAFGGETAQTGLEAMDLESAKASRVDAASKVKQGDRNINAAKARLNVMMAVLKDHGVDTSRLEAEAGEASKGIAALDRLLIDDAVLSGGKIDGNASGMVADMAKFEAELLRQKGYGRDDADRFQKGVMVMRAKLQAIQLDRMNKEREKEVEALEKAEKDEVMAAKAAALARLAAPGEVIALPFIGWRAWFLGKIAERTQSSRMRWEYVLRNSRWVKWIDKKLEGYPRVTGFADKLMVSLPSKVLSFDLVTNVLQLILLAGPEAVKTRLVPWLNGKYISITAKFSPKPKPDKDRLMSFYAFPRADEEIDATVKDWMGEATADKAMTAALKRLSDNKEDAGAYYDLANMLLAAAAKKEKAEGKKAAASLRELASKFAFMAVFFNDKDPVYQAALAKALAAQGKGAEALDQVKFALEKGKLPREEMDELRLIRAEVLIARNEFGAADEDLRNISTPAASKKADELRMKVNEGWKEEVKKAEAAKAGQKPGVLDGVKKWYAQQQKAGIGKAIVTMAGGYGMHKVIGLVVVAFIPGGSISSLMLMVALPLCYYLAGKIYDKAKNLITGEKTYTFESSQKADVKALEKYAADDPSDMDAQVRLVKRYMADGRANEAAAYMEKTAALFGRHPYKVWQKGYTSAENMARFAVAMMDAFAEDKALKDKVRAMALEKILANTRGIDARSPYIPIILARIALADGNADDALDILGPAEKLDLSLTANVMLFELRIDALKSRLIQESAKEERNKALIDKYYKELSDKSKEAGALKAESVAKVNADINAAFTAINDIAEKRLKEALSDAGEAGTHGIDAPIMAAKAETEELPEADAIKSLERRVALDPTDAEAAITLCGLYISNKNYSEAEKRLSRVLNMAKSAAEKSRAAEMLALARVLGNKRPGAKVLSNIADAGRRNVMIAIDAVNMGGQTDVEALLNAIIPPDPKTPITILNGIILVAAITALMSNINASERGVFADMREKALSGLGAVRRMIEERTFERPADAGELRAMLEGGMMEQLAAKVSGDAKSSKNINQLYSAFRKAFEKMLAVVGEISKLLAERRSDPANVDVKRRIFSKTEQYEAVRREMLKENVKARKAILELPAPLQAGMMAELKYLEDKYVWDAREYARIRTRISAEADREKLGQVVVERYKEVLDELFALLRKSGNDPVLCGLIAGRMNDVLKEYSAAVSESVPTADRSGPEWLGVVWLTDIMKDLALRQDWDQVLRLSVLSDLLDVAFARPAYERPRDLTFDSIVKDLVSVFAGIKDKNARSAAFLALDGILERGIYRGEGEEKEFLTDFLMQTVADDTSLRDLFVYLAEKRLAEERPTKNAPAWTTIFMTEKIKEMAGVRGDERASKIKAFAGWYCGVMGPGVDDEVIKQIDAVKDAGLKADILEVLAASGRVSTVGRINAYISLIKAAPTSAVRIRALEGLRNLIGGKDASEWAAQIDAIVEAVSFAARSGKLSEREASGVFNLLVALKAASEGKVGKDTLGHIGDAVSSALAGVKAARDAAIKERQKERYKDVIALVNHRKELAGFYEANGEFDKARSEFEAAAGMLDAEMKKMTALKKDGKIDEYGGPPDEVLAAITDTTSDLQRILEKLDAITPEWYISRAKGEISLARFYMEFGPKPGAGQVSFGGRSALDHLKEAFMYLDEAQRRDPKNAYVKITFDAARFERAR
ncbi:MAG: tetratricopeptide repeat protein, partial [Dehalococcoidales bacterium]